MVHGNNSAIVVSHLVNVEARRHMTAHTSTQEEVHRPVDRLFQLNWSSFWLLGAILAGIFGLIGFLLFGLVFGL